MVMRVMSVLPGSITPALGRNQNPSAAHAHSAEEGKRNAQGGALFAITVMSAMSNVFGTWRMA